MLRSCQISRRCVPCAECRRHIHMQSVFNIYMLFSISFCLYCWPVRSHYAKRQSHGQKINWIEHYAHTPYYIPHIFVERKFLFFFECIVNSYKYFEIHRYRRLQTYKHSLYFTLYISRHVSNNFQNVWFVRFCFIFLHSLYIILCCRLSMHVGILFGRNSVFSFVATYVWHCRPFGIIPYGCI